MKIKVFLETEYYDCAHLRELSDGPDKLYKLLRYQPGVKFYPMEKDPAKWVELPVQWEGNILGEDFVIVQFKDKDNVLRMDMFYKSTGKPLVKYFRYVSSITIEECLADAHSYIKVYGIKATNNSTLRKPIKKVTDNRINYLKFKILNLWK